MPSRPYLKRSIKELEALFAQNSDDAAVLDNLKVELGFRNTQRALTLKSKVLAANESAPKAAPKTKAKVKKPSTRGKLEPKAETPAQPAPVQPPVKKTTLKRSDLGPKPPVENSPQDILRAWTALEVLSPQGAQGILASAQSVAGHPKHASKFAQGSCSAC